jgi:hypothetical protein
MGRGGIQGRGSVASAVWDHSLSSTCSAVALSASGSAQACCSPRSSTSRGRAVTTTEEWRASNSVMIPAAVRGLFGEAGAEIDPSAETRSASVTSGEVAGPERREPEFVTGENLLKSPRRAVTPPVHTSAGFGAFGLRVFQWDAALPRAAPSRYRLERGWQSPSVGSIVHAVSMNRSSICARTQRFSSG